MMQRKLVVNRKVRVNIRSKQMSCRANGTNALIFCFIFTAY